MSNLLLDEVEYRVDETKFGVWRRYLYPTGGRFHEFRSHRTLFGLPLVHYTFGICPDTGRRVVAKGVIAVGRLAVGIVAIGHAALGLIAIGQLAIGILLGLGQAASGVAAVGQVALGVAFGLGQITTGVVAIGQFGLGKYVLAQLGFGAHVWSQSRSDPAAVEYFKSLVGAFTGR